MYFPSTGAEQEKGKAGTPDKLPILLIKTTADTDRAGTKLLRFLRAARKVTVAGGAPCNHRGVTCICSSSVQAVCPNTFRKKKKEVFKNIWRTAVFKCSES